MGAVFLPRKVPAKGTVPAQMARAPSSLHSHGT
jgi:hypothetical protein